MGSAVQFGPCKKGKRSSASGLGKRFGSHLPFSLHQDQQHLKLHLPERLTCVALSPNGRWLAAGSPNGQIYLWEVSLHRLQSKLTARLRRA